MAPSTHILPSIIRNPLHTVKERETESSCQFSTFGRMIKIMRKGKEKE